MSNAGEGWTHSKLRRRNTVILHASIQQWKTRESMSHDSQCCAFASSLQLDTGSYAAIAFIWSFL